MNLPDFYTLHSPVSRDRYLYELARHDGDVTAARLASSTARVTLTKWRKCPIFAREERLVRDRAEVDRLADKTPVQLAELPPPKRATRVRADWIAEAWQRHQEGWRICEIAREFGVSRQRVHQLLKSLKETQPKETT